MRGEKQIYRKGKEEDDGLTISDMKAEAETSCGEERDQEEVKVSGGQ